MTRPHTEPITALDDEIREFLLEAELPPLLAALAHATGDMTLLRPELRADPTRVQFPQGGLTREQQAGVRRVAFEAIVHLRDFDARPAQPISMGDLHELMTYTAGGVPMNQYAPLLEEELAADGIDRRAPAWHKRDLAPDRSFTVAIIGAGMSGLLAAFRLTQVGIPFVILEKNEEIGGTWWENTYPGCRVDNPNHLYSYSFAQRHDWPHHFSSQRSLHGYFRDFAASARLREHIRFRTEVTALTFLEQAKCWRVEFDGDGGAEELTVNAVISAVGQLNRPQIADIPGAADFDGPSFHSARWRHDVDLRGRRVAVIGTGASATQFVPEIAPFVTQLKIFQRTPNWLAPTPDYHAPVGEGLMWLYHHIPYYSAWNRFWIFWRTADGVLPSVTADANWDRGPSSVGRANDEFRAQLTTYLHSLFGDRPDLLRQAVPSYPVGAKRVLRDNGAWAEALHRPNVELITDDIVSIGPSGVQTSDGREHPADVIIHGTGFAASEFLAPMKVVGRLGIDLHQQWSGDPRAYLGITVPNFPNLFLLYGPNTNIVVNGSIVYFSECAVRYVLGCLEGLLRRNAGAIDCRADVHDEYNELVDRENDRMAWGLSTVSSWYKSRTGRVSQNWPFTLLDYWQRTRSPDPDDYEWLPAQIIVDQLSPELDNNPDLIVDILSQADSGLHRQSGPSEPLRGKGEP